MSRRLGFVPAPPERGRPMKPHDFRAWVGEMRERHGWTKTRCAKELGTTPVQIKRWETLQLAALHRPRHIRHRPRPRAMAAMRPQKARRGVMEQNSRPRRQVVDLLWKLAPAVGFEPTTNGLTVRCATAAPRRNGRPHRGSAAAAAAPSGTGQHISREAGVARAAGPRLRRHASRDRRCGRLPCAAAFC